MAASIRLAVLFSGLILWLVACGGVDEGGHEQPPLTFSPPSTPVVEGLCADIDPLERWLQTADLRYQEFSTFLNEVNELNDVQMYDRVTRLGEVVAIVSETPAPDCAAEAQRLMLDAMQVTAADFQTYVNQDNGNLDAIIQQARDNFTSALSVHEDLLAELELLYQAGASQG